MPRAWNRKHFLSALMRTAYLPAEIPPAITSKYFAQYCFQNFQQLYNDRDQLTKKSTTYETFTVPRTGKGRRNLAIVHPIAQLGLALQITHHRSRIKEIMARNGTSLYETGEDRKNQRAFSGLDFRRWEGLKREVCSQHPFIMKADISRFFYTVYTHTIPWSVLGKEKAKDWHKNHRGRLRNHWSNSLDMALQSCQSRETFGIPVGPDTSRIIAEMLMSGVESDPNYLAMIKGKAAYRLIDDFIVGFDDEREATQALDALRKALWKYNLQLNDEKTGIFRSETIFRDRWRLEFDSPVPSHYDEKEERRELNRLIDLTLHLCHEYRLSTPAIFACNRLSRFRLIGSNLEIAVRALLRFARDFPACTAHVAAFLINHQRRCRTLSIRNLIEHWIRESIRRNNEASNDLEFVWALMICAVFRIRIEGEELAPFDKIPNSIVFVMLGLLRERELLSASLSNWGWRAEFKNSGVYGENWLPLYEAVSRKWTKDSKIVSAVTSDRILNDMLSKKVTFIEDQILDAATLSLNRRTFRRHSAQHLAELDQSEDYEEDQETGLEEEAIPLIQIGSYDF